jgi:hypothetical protein
VYWPLVTPNAEIKRGVIEDEESAAGNPSRGLNR